MKSENLYNRISMLASAMMASRSIRPSFSTPLDATQESYLRVFQAQSNGKIDPQKGTPEAFLHGAPVNVCRELARAQRRADRRREIDGRPKAADDVVENVLHEERHRLTGEHFRELSDREQIALIRVYGPLYGRTHGGRPRPSDCAAAYKAVLKLRAWARGVGLLDD